MSIHSTMKSEPMVYNTVNPPPMRDQGPAAQAPSRPRGMVAASFRRFLVIAAIAFWLGGFTFYSGVAIPMGVEVLGGHRTVGFVTERVTNWLNVAGVATLAILLWNLLAVRASAGRAPRIVLTVTWLVMLAIEVELICLHPVMDHLLIAHGREIIDEDRFELLHHVYLISSSVQWLAGVLHVGAISVAWHPRSAAPS